LSAPHFAQRFSSGAPQSPQNFFAVGVSLPHFEQRISLPVAQRFSPHLSPCRDRDYCSARKAIGGPPTPLLKSHDRGEEAVIRRSVDPRRAQVPSLAFTPFRPNQYLRILLEPTIQHLLSIKMTALNLSVTATEQLKIDRSTEQSPPAGISRAAALEAHFRFRACPARTPLSNASRSQWRPDPSLLN
jgi:hypothetical protein